MAVADPFSIAADLFDPPSAPYFDDPVGYVHDELGFTPWSKQAEIMAAVRDHPKVAVRSCHGIGKTAGAAQIVLWFLDTHRNSRVITTAPTWAQVEQLLWREIRAGVARAHLNGTAQRIPVPTATKLELGVEWFAIGLSTNEPERFQGHHADHLLLVVDEASGVDEGIFEAAEGFLTAEGARVLLIGNPTRVGGQFHRAFTAERASWRQVHVSAYDSPNLTGEQVPAEVARSLVSEQWVRDKEKAWGRDSPMFQVRVLGEFPTQGTNNVIPLDQVEAAQTRDHQPDPNRHELVIACDVARYGDDETVIATRSGTQVRIEETYVGRPLTDTVGRIIRIAQDAGPRDKRIVVDDVGVGGGVTDMLIERGYTVTPFNGGHRAIVEDEYPNRRSELWFTMAGEIHELDLDGDEQLAADLTAPTYRLDSKGRRVVEAKDDTKKRLGRSPDRGDAVLLTLVRRGAAVVVEEPSRRRDTDRDPTWASTGVNPLTAQW